MDKEQIYKEELKLLKKLNKAKTEEKQEEIKQKISRVNESMRFADKDE